jgi:peptidyl-prolyl cis-trans isomerase C
MKKDPSGARRRLVSVLIVAVTALGLLVSVSGAGTAKETTPPDEAKTTRAIAARVNGAPIYEDALATLIDREFSKYKRFGREKPNPDLAKLLRQRALEKLIAVELISQASQRMEIPDIDSRIEKRFEAARNSHVAEASRMSDEELRDAIRRNIYIEDYLKRTGVREPEVPEAEIKAFYEKNPGSVQAQEMVHVRHILVQVAPDAKPEDKEKARKRIEEARTLVMEGKPFDEVAKEYSEDNAGPAGGDIGYVRKGYMPKEFDAVAFAIDENKVSDIVETRHGYHVLQVLEKQAGGVAPYERVRDFFRKYLQDQLARKNRNELIQALKKDAKIEIVAN